MGSLLLLVSPSCMRPTPFTSRAAAIPRGACQSLFAGRLFLAFQLAGAAAPLEPVRRPTGPRHGLRRRERPSFSLTFAAVAIIGHKTEWNVEGRGVRWSLG